METAQQIASDLVERFELTDSEIARRVESSQPTVWRLRLGKTKACSSELYRKLCLLRVGLEAERVAAPVAPERAVA